MKRLPQSKKLRIILSGVAIYTTVKQIRYGLFGFTDQVAASQKALEALEFSRLTYKNSTGIGGTWENLQVQVDIL